MEVYYDEDDGAIAQTVRDYLTGKNCKVTVSPTIAEAKTAMLSHIPSLVLVDWNMPDGQGDGFCQCGKAV